MRRDQWIVAILALTLWAVLPAILSRAWVDVLVFAGIYAVAGFGICLLLGYCGIVSLAQAVFYGIGAYATAYCTVTLGTPNFVGMLAGAGISMVIALAIGWPMLRLTGYFLALATLALGIIGNVLFLEWDWLTGGSLGIGGIPRIAPFGIVLDSPQRFYYFIWPIVAICALLLNNIVGDGRIGLAMRAMRDAPDAAIALAVSPQALKTKAFILSAMLGAISGSLFAHYVTFVSVQSFTIERSITFLLIPVLGGVTSVGGVIVGALVITVIPEILSGLGDFHQILFGLTLVLIVTVMPEGLSGLVLRIRQRFVAGENERP